MNTGKCSVEVLYFNVTVFVQYLNTHYNKFLSPIFKEKKLIDLKDANKKKTSSDPAVLNEKFRKNLKIKISNFSCKKKDFCSEKKFLARGKKHRLNGWFLNQKAPGLE